MKDEKGVSPVIGVILMVAITVILAAVIASFVFGMGTKTSVAPQVQLMVEDADDAISGGNEDLFKVTHYGGDDLKLDEIRLQVLNATESITLVWNGSSFKFEGGNLTTTPAITDGVLSVGESFTITESNNVFDKKPDTLTFRVIHIPTGTVIFESDVRVQ